MAAYAPLYIRSQQHLRSLNWGRTLFACLGPLLVRPASSPHSITWQAQQRGQSRLPVYRRTYVRGWEDKRVK